MFGIFSKVGRYVVNHGRQVTNFSTLSWGAGIIRGSANVLKDRTEREVIANLQPETFEQAVQRMGLSDEHLAIRRKPAMKAPMRAPSRG